MNEVLEKALYWTRQHSPQILATLGTGLVLGGIVATGVASAKINGKLQPHSEAITSYRETLANAETNGVDIAEVKKAIRKEYIASGLEVVKSYAVPTLLVTSGLGCLLGSNKILHTREMAIAGAYTALEGAYANYRAKTQESLGQVQEQKLYLDAQSKPVVETKEDGTTETTTQLTGNTYDFWWSWDMKNFEDDMIINLNRIRQIEDDLNWVLQNKKHHIEVEAIYEAYGVPEKELTDFQITAGKIAGWIYNPDLGIKGRISFGYHDEFGNLTEKGMALLDTKPNRILIEVHPMGDIVTPGAGKLTIVDAVKGVKNNE